MKTQRGTEEFQIKGGNDRRRQETQKPPLENLSEEWTSGGWGRQYFHKEKKEARGGRGRLGRSKTYSSHQTRFQGREFQVEGRIKKRGREQESKGGRTVD